ncbi:MAG: NADH:ubiquinone oxidoreductase subunit NDUFA12 [Alphaproteobacteria bacterium]|nr:NADH:ubiquinone oxidoreductase subunit NDUFA12 [Alphaproteobacteria bacterium]
MLFSWWKSQTLGTWLNTKLYGEAVGTDAFGNRYYESSKGRRWVIYNGTVEASRVPPDWHGWLHHTYAEPPTKAPFKTKGFEAPHQPNLTGTAGAYRPEGSLSRSGHRAPATGDYQAWKPE